MKKSDTLELTGYLLDINKKENKIDVQFYEQLPDGRQIATLVIGEKKMLKNLEEQHNKLGNAPEFNFKVIINKASLSDKAKEYLTENYSEAPDDIYEFELESFDSVK